MEIFKDIIGYEGNYQISNLGNVKSLKFNRNIILKLTKSRCGYYLITLSKTYSVHRLVAKHFILNTENKPLVNHINGIKTDNRTENLEWCTPKENTNHAISIGLTNRSGVNNANSKLTEKDILNIRKSKLSGVKLSKIYNITPTAISYVKLNKSYKNI